jgi:hypothetical protein
MTMRHALNVASQTTNLSECLLSSPQAQRLAAYIPCNFQAGDVLPLSNRRDPYEPDSQLYQPEESDMITAMLTSVSISRTYNARPTLSCYYGQPSEAWGLTSAQRWRSFLPRSLLEESSDTDYPSCCPMSLRLPRGPIRT